MKTGNDLDLGRIVNGQGSIRLTAEERATHLYVAGATGTGKSKFLENLIRQDILNWRKSECGLLLLDPHGSQYDSLMRWLSWIGIKRPIVPIDLRKDDWVIGYNVLRQRGKTDPAVLVEHFVQAMAHVWGQSGTDSTPLFARWASNVLRTLYANGLTLAEAELLVDHLAKIPREILMQKLSEGAALRDWRFANALSAKEFEAQIGSTINRLHRFLETAVLRQMFGQSKKSLDLGRCLEEGSIVLVSLATEGGKVGEEDARLFGTLLLTDLWTAARERGKRKAVKPFYLYCDEFQRFVTPTIGQNLDEARGYGLHLVLANQFPAQLLNSGQHGKAVYDSVMENARSKVVFSLSDKQNLEPLAQIMFQNTFDPDRVKHELWGTKVIDYTLQYQTAYSQSTGQSNGGGSQDGEASGRGFGGTVNLQPGGFVPSSRSRSKSRFASRSSGTNLSWSNTHQDSESSTPMLMPIMGKELSSVQFESLEEQLFRSMAVLHDQKQRQCVVRTVGMKAPVSIFTPFIKDPPVSLKFTSDFENAILKKLHCAIPKADAQKEVQGRKQDFQATLLERGWDELSTAKRKIK